MFDFIIFFNECDAFKFKKIPERFSITEIMLPGKFIYTCHCKTNLSFLFTHIKPSCLLIVNSFFFKLLYDGLQRNRCKSFPLSLPGKNKIKKLNSSLIFHDAIYTSIVFSINITGTKQFLSNLSFCSASEKNAMGKYDSHSPIILEMIQTM